MSCSRSTVTFLHLSALSAPHPNSQKCPTSLSSISNFTYLKNSLCGVHRRLPIRQRLSTNSSLMDLPLLPFPSNEVLVPSESKTLHLYEARYLALLEESLVTKKFFVHFILEPVLTSSYSVEASFAARYGCLVLIEDVEQLDIGALVSIRGISRVNIIKFVQIEPYLRGAVIPMKDDIPDCLKTIDSVAKELKDAVYNLHSLEIKLKGFKDEKLQTCIMNSVRWAGRETTIDSCQDFLPTFAEQMSFAALQPVSGSTNSELIKLQKEKLQAMDLKDTHKRLITSLEYTNQNIAMVAAKLALQSL